MANAIETKDTEILTTEGLKRRGDLVYKEGQHENDTEAVQWQEYWFEGRLVKRDVQMQLKSSVFAAAEAAKF